MVGTTATSAGCGTRACVKRWASAYRYISFRRSTRCDSIVAQGVIANPWNIRNEEQRRPLLLCHLRGTFADVWADLRKP